MKKFFNKCVEYGATALIFLLLVAFFAGAVWFRFYIWSLKHPGAPWWTFLF
jgi:hypothetical protein